MIILQIVMQLKHFNEIGDEQKTNVCTLLLVKNEIRNKIIHLQRSLNQHEFGNYFAN